MYSEHWIYVQQVQDFMNTYGVVAGASATIGALLWWWKAESPGEGKMTKEEYQLTRREQRQKDQNNVADALADGLLTAFTKGTISEETYKKVHLKLGAEFGFKDLLPVKLTPKQGKLARRKR